MALADLLATLERNARVEADRILDGAKQEAAEITARADEEASLTRTAFLAAREREYRATADETIAAVRRETRAAMLQARDRFLQRVLNAARDSLPTVAARPSYRAALPGHVADALRYAEDRDVVVRCPPALASIISTAVSERNRVSIEPDTEVGTGVTVVARDGALRVPHTLEARLEHLEPVLCIEILQRLEQQSCDGNGAT